MLQEQILRYRNWEAHTGEGGSGICQVPLGSTGRFQMDSGTPCVHAELKPRAKANPTACGRYRTAVGVRAVGRAQPQGLVPGAQWEQSCIRAGAIGRGLELPGDAF